MFLSGKKFTVKVTVCGVFSSNCVYYDVYMYDAVRRDFALSSSFVLVCFDGSEVTTSLRADEILWLTPSAKQRRNPCSGLPAVYPDLSTRHDWQVKKGLCFVCRDRQSG